MWNRALPLTAVLLLASCDRRADTLLPSNLSDAAPIVEAGELSVLTLEEYQDYLVSSDKVGWCAEEDDDGATRCLYAQVGTPELGKKGGATFTFKGTGDYVCLMLDPETVFWNTAVSPENPDPRYTYPDYTLDDGDIDLFAGLTSYYTGSPGLEIGDFKGFYTDSLGREIEIEYGECAQGSSVADITNAHSGRATVESCRIDTDQRAGIEYTVVLETFSVPLDDGALSFGAMAVAGSCRDIVSTGVTECAIQGESLNEKGKTRSCTEAFEDAYCKDEFDTDFEDEAEWAEAGYQPLSGFCCANPEMCGDPDEKACLGFDRDAWCDDFPGWCCD